MLKFTALALIAGLAVACSHGSRGGSADSQLERMRDRTNTNASPSANDNSPLGREGERVRDRTNTNVSEPK